MPPTRQANEDERAATSAATSERAELLDHLQSILEPAMIALGFIFLGLLLLDYGAFDLSDQSQQWVGQSLQVIWAIFLLDFVVRLWIAPAKVAFLRSNWLAAVSLALPFLRPLRAFRAARALRSISLVRLLGSINRGMRVLRRVTRGQQFAYVGALTVFVVLIGAVGALYFDRGVADAPIQTFGDALWWSAAMVTTINNEKYAVSLEARIIAILQRVYAVSVFGYITASIASYLVGGSIADNDETARLRGEIAALREELRAVRLGRGPSLVDSGESTGMDRAGEEGRWI